MKAFTLIEILIAIAILAILITFVILVIDPVQRFASARNTQRISDLNTMMIAISQNIADNKGNFSCASGETPTNTTRMAVATSTTSTFDIAPCLIPIYLEKLPYDPSATSTYFASTTAYDTGYYISQNTSTNRITLDAPFAELGVTTTLTR